MFEDAKLNFEESLDASVKLNFGAENKEDDLLVYRYPFDIEIQPYDIIYINFQKGYTEKQEVKSFRLVLIDRDTSKAVKKLYSKAIRLGVEELYRYSYDFRPLTLGISREEFNRRYKVDIEIVITDIDKTGEANVESLVSNFNCYLRRRRDAE